MKQIRISEILERLNSLNNFEKDGELARFLDIKQNRLSGWKTRGTIVYELFFAICEREGLDPLWLFLGKGQAPPSPVSLEDRPKEEIKHSIDRFWEVATADEKAWFKLHFKREFEFHRKYLEDKDRDGEFKVAEKEGAFLKRE
ncbi:MAG: helix-turn-helix domain-containing protein [Desulfatiglandales bacterium]